MEQNLHATQFNTALFVVTLLILVFLLFCSSMFSSIETAYSTLNPGKIESIVDNKEFGSKLIKKQYGFFNRILALILICNNIANIGLSAAISYLMSKHLSENYKDYSAIISTAVLTPIIVLLGEIVPKLIAKARPVQVAKAFCYPVEFLYWIFFPIIWVLGKMSKNIYITNTEQDVKNLLDVAHNEGVLEANESIMAQNALDLDTTKVRKHYTKIKDLYYLPYNANIQEALAMFKETNYSRLPVEKDGQFLGIVLLKDIFFLEKGKIIKYLKTIPSISANSSLAIALETLRKHRSQMAFVKNNNSSTNVIGIITIEDIIEEVVGEIYDEYDDEEVEDIFEISLELFEASNYVIMKDLLKRMNLDLEITEKERNMELGEWFKFKQNIDYIHKNDRFEFEGVSFKAILSPTKKQNHYRFEIEISNTAPINLDKTEELDASLSETKIFEQ
ncbi:hemolysin C [Mycoplasmopsis bovigenitalium]|uniref:CNNM domain-containing protein n=1 Tax=Mycoplasmopsis bovigenitalium TaxID=2112 RepID=UPI00090B1B32|nr:CNNM domain-containing protein [Mycoplasmopsis bovigenitalium]BAW18524.1 hemolysin C [Mycoplasmopsis bovigenitalium]